MGGFSGRVRERVRPTTRSALALFFLAPILACSSSKPVPASGSVSASAPVSASTSADSAPAGAATAPEPASRLIGRAESKSHCEKVDAPVLISRREAKYPDEIRRQRIEGTVVVQGIVSTEGALTEIKVLEGSDSRLTELALDAFRTWQYKPALCVGEPIEAYVTATFSFKLDR